MARSPFSSIHGRLPPGEHQPSTRVARRSAGHRVESVAGLASRWERPRGAVEYALRRRFIALVDEATGFQRDRATDAVTAVAAALVPQRAAHVVDGGGKDAQVARGVGLQLAVRARDRIDPQLGQRPAPLALIVAAEDQRLVGVAGQPGLGAEAVNAVSIKDMPMIQAIGPSTRTRAFCVELWSLYDHNPTWNARWRVRVPDPRPGGVARSYLGRLSVACNRKPAEILATR